MTTHCITRRHITSHHTTLHHITSPHLISHHITSHHITSHYIISYRITQKSHHITQHPNTSHHIIYHIISNHIIYHIKSHQDNIYINITSTSTSHHTTPYNTSPTIHTVVLYIIKSTYTWKIIRSIIIRIIFRKQVQHIRIHIN